MGGISQGPVLALMLFIFLHKASSFGFGCYYYVDDTQLLHFHIFNAHPEVDVSVLNFCLEVDEYRWVKNRTQIGRM